MVDSRTAPEVGNRDHRRRSAPRRDRRYRPARLPRRLDGTPRDARPSDCRCSIPTSATTKFVDEQGEGASPAGACVSRPAASAAAATPTAHAAGIAARVPTRIRLRARPPRGGSPGVCPRTRGSCPRSAWRFRLRDGTEINRDLSWYDGVGGSSRAERDAGGDVDGEHRHSGGVAPANQHRRSAPRGLDKSTCCT